MNNQELWYRSEAGTWVDPKGESSLRSHLAKACGQMVYASDMYLPNMLVGKALRSPYPHCKINHIDVSAAEKIPGVHAVLTAKDIPGKNFVGKTVDDQPFIASTKARTVLDTLAIVAAENEEIADRALQAIVLDLEPLPAVFTPQEALLPDSPQLYPNGNLLLDFSIIHGNAQEAMKQADVIVEDTYRYPWIEHAYLETESVVAVADEDGIITVWLGVHNIYGERQVLSQAFGWPEHKFRVIHVPPGGSFGGKDDNIITVWAALLAYRTGRPVRFVLSRKDSMRGHSKRQSQIVHHKLGALYDGTIVAAQVEILSDTGAYAHWGIGIIQFASLQSTGPYRVPNASVNAKLVYTNNIVGGAMRCWGTPGVEFAAETQMNRLAKELEMHPLKLRWINALRKGDLTITGTEVPPDCYVKETIEAAAHSIGLTLDGR